MNIDDNVDEDDFFEGDSGQAHAPVIPETDIPNRNDEPSEHHDVTSFYNGKKKSDASRHLPPSTMEQFYRPDGAHLPLMYTLLDMLDERKY